MQPSSSPQSQALFAYGTLLVPAVVHARLGWSPASQPAILQDFARFGVRGEAFPGIVPRAGARVEGQLLYGLTPQDWGKLDDFEGDWYERTAVTVLTAEGPWPALVYVVAPEHDALLTGEPWDLETHTQQIIDRYGPRS